jgi:hypothetical protein
MQSQLASTRGILPRSSRRAAAIAAAVGVVQFAVTLSTAQATTYVIATAGASALGSFDRDNSSATNPVSGSFSPGVLALGQAAGGTLQIGNTVYTEPSSGQALLGSDKTGAAQEDPASSDQLLYEFSETGSVFGLADLTNSNGLSVALNPGATAPNPSSYIQAPIAPDGPLPLWVNGTQFTAPGTQGTSPSNTATRYIGSNSSGSSTFANASSLSTPLNGSAAEAPVQIAFSDVPFQQAYAIAGGTSSLTAVPFQLGYGLGKGATKNVVTGQPSETNFQALANSTSIIGGINASTTYLRNQTVAVEEFNFVANPGTGLGEISKSDAQWLEATGRFQNGANFNMITRDIGSGTRNEGALNLGLDPSFASGERDRIADSTYKTTDYNGNPVTVNAGDEASPLLSLTGSGTLDYNENRIGPDIRYSDKISGGSGVRATVVAGRMALGILGGGDSNSSSGTALAANSGVGNNVSSKPAVRALAIDFGKGNGYTQGTVANISGGSYDLWSNSQAITVAPYADPTLNDGTYTTRPILNDLLEQNNGTQTITTTPSTYNTLQSSDPNGPGIVRKFLDNITNSVTTYSATSSTIAPADYLLTGGYLLPQTISITKQYDGDAYTSNPNFNQGLYNTYATNSGLEQQYTDWADPNTTNGNLNGSQSYTIYTSDNNAVNGATPNLTIPISPRTVLAGDFNDTGVRDNQQVPALALAYASPTTYLNTPASGDPRGWNYDGVQVQSTTQSFPGVGAFNYSSKLQNGSAGNFGDGLIVLSDFDGQGNVINNNSASFSVLDGVARENVLYFLYGCTVDTQDAVGSVYTPGAATVELNGSTESLTAAQNASVNGVRYGHLTKNYSIVQFDQTIQSFVTGSGSTSLGLSQAQANALLVDRFDTNLDGSVDRNDAKNVDSLVGKDYTNISDVMSVAPIVQNMGTTQNPDYEAVPVDPIVAATLIDGTAATPHTKVTSIANTSLPAGQQSDEMEMVYHLQGRDVNPSLTGNETVGNALVNGDANFDGTVDLADYNTVLSNFNTGTKWGQGNFKFSGTTDLSDYNAVLSNFNKTAGLSSVPYGTLGSASPDFVRAGSASGVHSAFTLHAIVANAAPTPTASDVQILVNITTGDVKIFDNTSGNTSVLSGYEIDSPSGSLIPFSQNRSGITSNYALESNKGGSTGQPTPNPNAVNNAVNNEPVGSSSSDPTGSQGAGNGGYDNFVKVSNVSTAISEASPSDSYQDPLYNSANTDLPSLTNGGFDLGDIFKGLGEGGVEDLTFKWSDAFRSDGSVDTFEPYNGTVVDYTPEPASLGLIGLAGVAMLRRRRRTVITVGLGL